MLLTKTVKAATLLYALLMLSVFTLLVQFYLESQVAIARGTQLRQLEVKAYMMAQMAFEEWQSSEVAPLADTDKTKPSQDPSTLESLSFTEGIACYKEKGQQLLVSVQLDSGQEYQYVFLTPSEK